MKITQRRRKNHSFLKEPFLPLSLFPLLTWGSSPSSRPWACPFILLHQTLLSREQCPAPICSGLVPLSSLLLSPVGHLSRFVCDHFHQSHSSFCIKLPAGSAGSYSKVSLLQQNVWKCSVGLIDVRAQSLRPRSPTPTSKWNSDA
jgi:hypothetical protein